MLPFPTPYNEQTVIRYDIPQTGRARLQLFDLAGRLVKSYFDEPRVAGSYTLNVTAIGLASGVYFAKLSQGELSVTTKLLLIR